MSTVLIVGLGDMGERVAWGLAAGGRTRRIVLVGRSQPRLEIQAARIASSSDCVVEPVVLDALAQDRVAELLDRVRPDLVVQCASLRSPWALVGREDGAARGVAAAGLGLRLPHQLPVVLAVMRAAKDAGYDGPIANLSLPDLTGPVLRSLGLAPTVGLGNVGMMLRRVRAVLRAGAPEAQLPVVRVLGHHSQVYGVMQALEPASPDDRCRVYLGEDGQRDDALAYLAEPLAPGVGYNAVTGGCLPARDRSAAARS
jgi:hypothetical protein